MSNPLSKALLQLAKLAFDSGTQVPFFRSLDVIKEARHKPDFENRTTDVGRQSEINHLAGPSSPSGYRSFLSLAGKQIGHSTAFAVWEKFNPEMNFERVKNYVLSEVDYSNVSIEAAFDAANLLHVMKFLGDFDSELAERITRQIERKHPIFLPIILERVRDLQVRVAGDEDLLLEYGDIGERFMRAEDTHGFVHNGLWRCAIIQARRKNFDEADKLLDHADMLLERGVLTNPLFVQGRPLMDTYRDKIANCMRSRAMVEAHKEVYKGTRMFAEAEKYSLKALWIHGEIGQVHGMANDLRDLAKIYLLDGNFDAAAICIHRAQCKYKTVEDLVMVEECNNVLKLNSIKPLQAYE
jgi:tetratricopeptide (TPR) repeat protein